MGYFESMGSVEVVFTEAVEHSNGYPAPSSFVARRARRFGTVSLRRGLGQLELFFRRGSDPHRTPFGITSPVPKQQTQD